MVPDPKTLAGHFTYLPQSEDSNSRPSGKREELRAPAGIASQRKVLLIIICFCNQAYHATCAFPNTYFWTNFACFQVNCSLKDAGTVSSPIR